MANIRTYPVGLQVVFFRAIGHEVDEDSLVMVYDSWALHTLWWTQVRTRNNRAI